MTRVFFQDWGLIPYKEAFEKQEDLFQRLINLKQNNNTSQQTENYLIFCEHPHVITLGKSGHKENLLFSEEELKKRGIEFFHTTRGGDITYHGPGQLVGYPILNLENFHLSIKKYIYLIEEVVIKVLAHYKLKGERAGKMTGVWLDAQHPAKARKICAIGVKASRYVTMHGFAFNINTQLQYFDFIVPCGIKGRAVTSLERELGQKIDMKEAKTLWIKYFQELFNAHVTDFFSYPDQRHTV